MTHAISCSARGNGRCGAKPLTGALTLVAAGCDGVLLAGDDGGFAAGSRAAPTILGFRKIIRARL